MRKSLFRVSHRRLKPDKPKPQRTKQPTKGDVERVRPPKPRSR